MSRPDISIVTCFHNSGSRLNDYFAALRLLEFGTLAVEFVFVDNASSDDTGHRLKQEAVKLGAPARVVSEPVQGLMHARCTGVAAALGDWLLCLDDDNEAQSDYLLRLWELKARYPHAKFISGNVLLPSSYQVDPEVMAMTGIVAIRCLPGERCFEMNTVYSPYGPWGAGLFCRRDDLLAACIAWQQGDCRITGRTGADMSGGEDHWLVHFVCRGGRAVVFSDRLVIFHRLTKHRVESGYLLSMNYKIGFDWPDHLDAFKQLRPELPDCYPIGLNVWHFVLWRLPRSMMVYLFRRRFVSLASAAWHAGMAIRLLQRDWGARSRAGSP